MDRENIYEIFCRFTGLDSETASDFYFMCDTACDYVLSRIKPGADISEAGGRLDLAAAALAYYRYVLWSLTDDPADQIRVGEISVRNNSAKALDRADRLCREAFRDVYGLLEDEDFVFRRMP